MYKWRLTYTRDYFDEELKPVQEKLLEFLASTGEIDRDEFEALADDYDWNYDMFYEALVELAKKMGWNADQFMSNISAAWDDYYDCASDEVSVEMRDEATEYLVAHINNTPCAVLTGSPQSSPT